MEKFVKYFMFVLLASAVIFAGCSKDDDDGTPTTPTTTTYDLLADYMVNHDMDVDKVISEWIAKAEDVATKGTDAYHIIDLRSPETFDAGHIDGAVNSTLGGILEAADGATKPIIVVCYTGQSAGHAVIALRLSGYADAKVLKFGMSGWNSSTSEKWVNAVADGDYAVGNANWIVAPGAITPNAEFALPVLQSTSTDGAIILAERVAAMLEGGFMAVAKTAVLESPANYFINNYWDLEDVQNHGNIIGAYRIKPFTLAAGSDKNLDASSTVVTYCWTGQTSSMMTAYLTVLGYDAKSLAYGANGMIYSDLEASHQYTLPAVDYPIVPTK